MTFTYTLTTDVGKVRFELGDGVANSGVRANGSNLTDEEIQMLIDRELSVLGATAAACEMLARDWAKMSSISVGPRSESIGKVSAEWASRAIEMRNSLGGNYATFSIGTKRTDGFSEQADISA